MNNFKRSFFILIGITSLLFFLQSCSPYYKAVAIERDTFTDNFMRPDTSFAQADGAWFTPRGDTLIFLIAGKYLSVTMPLTKYGVPILQAVPKEIRILNKDKNEIQRIYNSTYRGQENFKK